jgi:hypothetical protein
MAGQAWEKNYGNDLNSDQNCKGVSLIAWGNLMAIVLHVKRIHTDSYDHFLIR